MERQGRIRQARYNTKYKEIKLEGRGPRYLRQEKGETLNRGEEVRALVKLRCGNLESANKYWLGEEEWKCVLCRKGRECMEHFVEECEFTKEWFIELGKDKDEILKKLWDEELNNSKGRILRKLWKEKERITNRNRIN